MGRRERKRKQLVADLKAMKNYWKVKNVALSGELHTEEPMEPS
jgi:hypothetical protein